MKKHLVSIKKYIIYLLKVWIWPFSRKVFILIGVISVLVYAAGKMNWEPEENWAIDKLTRQEPLGRQTYMPFQGKVDIPDTKAYKKEKLLIFKTNMKSTVQLLALKIGPPGSKHNEKLTSISDEISKNSRFNDLSIYEFNTIEPPDTKAALTDWDIIKVNLNDGFSALLDMVNVKIMTEDGKPMIVKVVKEKPILVEYDSSDKVMRWGKEIQAASMKYGIDSAVIAAVIEQESGDFNRAGKM